jgi:predicted phage terminase large subunit-like protein
VRFWVHEEIIGKPDVSLIISDHRDNEYLSKDEHAKIEGITDPEFHKVYARGRTGKIEGLLFPESDLHFEDLSHIDYSLASFRFAVGDPADTGGDYYAMPFCYVFFNERVPAVVVRDVIFNKNGIEANTEIIKDKVASLGMEKVFIESNGGWVSSAVLLKQKIQTIAPVAAYNVKENKLVRILSNYEFIKAYFVFDINYKARPEYKAFMNNLTTFMRDEKNKNDDAPDVLSAASAFVKAKYQVILYGKG